MIDTPNHRRPAVSDPATTIEEFDEYQRTTTNREVRPYEETTIGAYPGPATHLDKWMTSQGIDGDATVADTRTLNRHVGNMRRAPLVQSGPGRGLR